MHQKGKNVVQKGYKECPQGKKYKTKTKLKNRDTAGADDIVNLYNKRGRRNDCHDHYVV